MKRHQMKWIGFAVCFFLVGCQRHENTPEHHVNVITTGPVQLSDTPPVPDYNPELMRLVSYTGNIDITSRLFDVPNDYGTELTVYIKRSNTGEWEQLIPSQTNPSVPTYTLGLATREVRFQNCAQGWLYTVYLITPKQPGLLG